MVSRTVGREVVAKFSVIGNVVVTTYTSDRSVTFNLHESLIVPRFLEKRTAQTAAPNWRKFNFSIKFK
jgi:hypothetical protein